LSTSALGRHLGLELVELAGLHEVGDVVVGMVAAAGRTRR
jgi:hypothetical protein